MIRQHLGLPHFSLALTCRLCHANMNTFGTHALDCKKNLVYGRHNAVVDALVDLCKEAGVRFKKEVRVSEESARRPADIEIDDLEDTTRWIDVGVINPTNNSNVNLAVKDGKQALLGYADKKKALYRDLIEGQKAKFTPFICDIYGAISEEGLQLLKRLSSIAAARNGGNWKTYLRQARQRICIALLKTAGIQITNTLEN
jgi:hypothetical protein